MKKGIVLVALGAVSLLVAAPNLAAKDKDKPKPKDVDVVTESTITITPGISQATYAGQITTRSKLPTNKGPKSQRNRRRTAAELCIEFRTVSLNHKESGFHIGTTVADEQGRWVIVGNKPPSGHHVTVFVPTVESKYADCEPASFEVVSP